MYAESINSYQYLSFLSVLACYTEHRITITRTYMPTEPTPVPYSLKELIALRSDEVTTYLEDARSTRVLTYAQLAHVANSWGVLFQDLHLAQGSTIILDIADPLSFAAVELSVVAAGHRAIPVDPGAPWDDVEHISDLMNSAQLIVTARTEKAGHDTVLSVDAATFMPAHVPSEVPQSTNENAAGGSITLFTSGSTGAPKGVELPESQLMYVATHIARHNKLTPHDRGYNSLPLFHVNAQVVGLLATLVAGATLVLDARFHREGFWGLLDERNITWMNGAPAILAILARTGEINIPSSLRFIRSASAPLPDIIREAFKDVPLLVSYGMTEGASQITATPLDQPFRPGSVGVVVGNELQIRDSQNAPLATGSVGSVWIRGEGVVKSYLFGRAAERFDADGWLQTGDLGKVDQDGYVYLMGRSDDVINRGGEKLYPAEIENVLLEDESVQEAVVAAREDDVLGQVPVAYVIPVVKNLSEAEKTQLVASLHARCVAALSKFKRPAGMSIVDDLPRAATGKFQRVKIREKALHNK